MMTKPHRDLSWAALLPPLLVPMAGSLLYFVFFPEGDLGKSIYTATKLFTLIYPFLFLRQIGLGGIIRRRHDPSVSWPSWKSVFGVGLGSGLLIAIAGGLLMLTPVGELVRQGAEAVGERAEGLGFKDNFVLFAIFLSIVHSALEEFYWRWFAYGQLRHKVSRGTAHVLAAIAFGGHHLIITLQFFPIPLAFFLTLCVVIGGFIWSIMYERQGTVIGCWISHICVDVMLMVIGFQLIMGG